jgi:signal transduction histidine kinase
MMSLVKLHINVIDFEDIEDAKRRIVELKSLVVRVIQDVRDLSKTLDPDRISANGFEGIIKQELESVHNAGLLQYQFIEEGTKPILDISVEVELLRILQEALHNVIKHSNASYVLFKVDYTSQKVRILFEDNGVGFILDEREGVGNGLKNMRSRANFINAVIDLESVPGSGTRLKISF